jgi:hypothetical protein
MALGAFLRRLAARLRPASHRPASLRPAVLHRLTLHCPRGGQLVEVDILMGPTGMPARIVRCPHQGDGPPACDQACLTLHEALAGHVDTLLILPPGREAADEID